MPVSPFPPGPQTERMPTTLRAMQDPGVLPVGCGEPERQAGPGPPVRLAGPGDMIMSRFVSLNEQKPEKESS